MLGRVWRRWIKVAEIIGNIQMIIILSLLYWTIFAVVAIPFKFFADPLRLKHPDRVAWILRDPIADVSEYMTKQG